MNKYRIHPFYQFSAGDDFLVAGGESLNAHMLVPAPLHESLSRCTSFKSVKDHSCDVWENLTFGQKIPLAKAVVKTYSELFGHILVGPRCLERMLSGILEKYSETGFLLSKESFSFRVGQAMSRKNAPSRISCLGILTCDRVSTLEGSLSSYVEHADQTGQSINYYICDDSTSPSVQDNYISLLKKVSQRFHTPLFYSGRREKEKYLEQLVQVGLPRDVVKFALLASKLWGPTHGANRNGLLLETAGSNIFCADDDTLCLLGESPEYNDEIKLGFNFEDVKYWFYETREKALRSQKKTNCNLFKLNNQFLGRSLAECLSDFLPLNRVNYGSMNYSLLKDIYSGEGKVVATFPGLLGDSGSNYSNHLLFLNGDHRTRLTGSAESYRLAMSSREVCKTVSQVSLGQAQPCMTTFFGLDNRDCLPPFFPVFRNEDALFGRMIRTLSPRNYFAHLPWTLVHHPQERRFYSEQTLLQTESFWPTEAVSSGVMMFGNNHLIKDTPKLMNQLGDHLLRLGDLPFEDYSELMRAHQLNSISRSIVEYENLRRERKKSAAYWLSDILKVLTQHRNRVHKEINLAPAEMVSRFGKDQAERITQKFVQKFGKLVKWWPSICEAAKQLKKSGIKLSKEINCP